MAIMQAGQENQGYDVKKEVSQQSFGFPRTILLVTLLLMAQLAYAAVPIDDYKNRLEEAQKISKKMAEEDFPARVVISRLNSIKKLLPSRENIELEGLSVYVDNSWLHEAIDIVIQNAYGDIEQRHSMLTEIKFRLTNLYERVKQGALPQVAADNDARARIESILARPDYRPEKLQESTIRRWARMLNAFISELFKKIFGTSSSRTSPASGGGGATVFRIVIL